MEWAPISGGLSVELLEGIGTPPSTAAVLAVQSSEGAATLRTIIDRTRLPEAKVSTGLRRCRMRGWIEAIGASTTSRGRPARAWILTLSEIELLKQIARELRGEHTLLRYTIRELEGDD